jgi:hypothetical protein
MPVSQRIKRRSIRPNVKRGKSRRITAPNPSGVKKRGLLTAFQPRTLVKYGRFLEKNMKTKISLRKRIQGAEFASQRLVQNALVLSMKESARRLDRAMLDKRSDDRVSKLLRNLLMRLHDLSDGISEKMFSDIKIAVFYHDRRSEKSVPASEIMKLYKDTYVDEDADNYAEDMGRFISFLRGGVMDNDGPDSHYVVPGMILEKVKMYKGGKIYAGLERTEKEFMNQAIKWLRDRTPDVIYCLETDKPIPSWYVRDIVASLQRYPNIPQQIVVGNKVLRLR